jgi:hypothetical protein
MSPFVGISEQLLTEEQLRELLQQQATSPSYYFLRWTHKVSGFKEFKGEFEEFPSLEGQLFNCERELRWKQQGQKYTVLLLSNTGQIQNFISIVKDEEKDEEEYWKTEQRAAYGYRRDETRFPQSLVYPESLDIRMSQEEPKTNKPKLAQRYFIDKKTSIVHFVALTVEMPQ